MKREWGVARRDPSFGYPNFKEYTKLCLGSEKAKGGGENGENCPLSSLCIAKREKGGQLSILSHPLRTMGASTGLLGMHEKKGKRMGVISFLSSSLACKRWMDVYGGTEGKGWIEGMVMLGGMRHFHPLPFCLTNLLLPSSSLYSTAVSCGVEMCHSVCTLPSFLPFPHILPPSIPFLCV